MRKRKEIEEYENEAFEAVWLIRTFGLFAEGKFNDTPADITSKAKEESARICSKFNLSTDEEKDEFCNDWNYGYWSGIMTALRWVMGEEKDDLDT